MVFPTETVYGLGADATSKAAVAAIYAAKGRPSDNPLIVHVASLEAAVQLAASWPADAEALARAFWPGPLTLVLPRKAGACDPAAAGGTLATIAVRVPGHPVAQALLRAAGIPLAAPSANTSGRPSPTRAADARDDLGRAVAVYLDGGPTHVGLESTVVAVPARGPVEVLRLGGIPFEAIERVVGKAVVRTSAAAGETPAAPGMKYRHYAPVAPVRLLAPEALRQRYEAEPEAAFIVATETGLSGPRVRVPGSRADGAAWAHHLFAMLRDLDSARRTVIYVEAIPEAGLGAAVMDRVRKASQG